MKTRPIRRANVESATNTPAAAYKTGSRRHARRAPSVRDSSTWRPVVTAAAADVDTAVSLTAVSVLPRLKSLLANPVSANQYLNYAGRNYEVSAIRRLKTDSEFFNREVEYWLKASKEESGTRKILLDVAKLTGEIQAFWQHEYGYPLGLSLQDILDITGQLFVDDEAYQSFSNSFTEVLERLTGVSSGQLRIGQDSEWKKAYIAAGSNSTSEQESDGARERVEAVKKILMHKIIDSRTRFTLARLKHESRLRPAMPKSGRSKRKA